MHKIHQKSLKMFCPYKLRTLFCSPKILQLQYASLYEVLGVTMDATPTEIKSAYLKKSKKFHPDFNLESDTKLEFLKVQNAYHTLSNPQQRSAYDHTFNSLDDKQMFHSIFHKKAEAPNVWEYCHHFHHSASLHSCDPGPTKKPELTKFQQFYRKHSISMLWVTIVFGSIFLIFVPLYKKEITDEKFQRKSKTLKSISDTKISPLRAKQISGPAEQTSYKEIDIPKRQG